MSSVPDAENFHHSAYVILLNPAVLKHPSIQRLNPGHLFTRVWHRGSITTNCGGNMLVPIPTPDSKFAVVEK